MSAQEAEKASEQGEVSPEVQSDTTGQENADVEPSAEPESAPAEPTSPSPVDTAHQFQVNDILIAKVKGYPPWPAIVVTRDHLPEKIRNSQPKSRDTTPIMFINDNSYMWAPTVDLRDLGVEEATKHANRTKTKKALREAYRIASERPTVEAYLEALLNPPPPPEPKPKRAKKASEKPAAAPRAARSTLKSIKRKLKEGPIEEASTEEGAEGVEGVRRVIELKRPKQRGRPTAGKDSGIADKEDLEALTELRAELCRQARFRIQKALLVEDPKSVDLEPLFGILDQVDEIEIEVAIVRMSKLHKVLRLVADMDIDSKFKARCESLLAKWNTPIEPIVRGLPENEVDRSLWEEVEPSEAPGSEAPEEETAEPSAEPGSVAASDAISAPASEAPEHAAEPVKAEPAEPAAEPAANGGDKTEAKLEPEAEPEAKEEAKPEAQSTQ